MVNALGLVLAAVASAPSEPVASILDYDSRAPLEEREQAFEDVQCVRVSDISYASPKGGRVTAYVVAPPGKLVAGAHVSPRAQASACAGSLKARVSIGPRQEVRRASCVRARL